MTLITTAVGVPADARGRASSVISVTASIASAVLLIALPWRSTSGRYVAPTLFEPSQSTVDPFQVPDICTVRSAHSQKAAGIGAPTSAVAVKVHVNFTTENFVPPNRVIVGVIVAIVFPC